MSNETPVRDRPQVRLTRAIMRANAAFRSLYRSETAERVGLSLSEFDFLAALGNTDGLRMSDLAHAMITTPSNVTRVCSSMEKKGLAVRERSPESDREVIARLTPAGQKRFDEVFLDVVRWTEETLDRGANTREQVAAAEVLEKIVESLD